MIKHHQRTVCRRKVVGNDDDVAVYLFDGERSRDYYNGYQFAVIIPIERIFMPIGL